MTAVRWLYWHLCARYWQRVVDGHGLITYTDSYRQAVRRRNVALRKLRAW